MSAFLSCLCGHMHGLTTCAVEDCDCPRLTRCRMVGVWNSEKQRFEQRPDISEGNTATIAPGYHLRAYGLKNPAVQEALRLGAYFDIAPEEPCPADALDADSVAVARRVLNPVFVEMLMGWPPGWTSLEPLDSGSPATGSCPHRPSSHSEHCGRR